MDNVLKLQYQSKIESELLNGILPFWMDKALDNQGSYYGHISNDMQINKEENKGSVVTARILWVFSAAYRLYNKPEYLEVAQKTYQYLIDHFWDKKYLGFYWTVDAQGNASEGKKKIYAQAFSIYGLAEFYRATGNEESLKYAKDTFGLIEKHSFDKENGGYFEAYEEDWSDTEDYRLSERAMNEKKSMNTHLHILEAYTCLLRVWDSSDLKLKLKNTIETIVENIIDKTNYHFIMFQNEKWVPKCDIISYGHDIEGSWLLYEAAEVLNDSKITEKIKDLSIKMAEACLNEGVDVDGAMYYDGSPTKILDDDKHWWVQAEAVVGFMNAYQLTGEEKYLDASLLCWNFIEKFIIDKVHGEWFWKVSREGKPRLEMAKVNSWKCPYHNSRMCFEFLERIEKF